jgi:hypothetical protein
MLWMKQGGDATMIAAGQNDANTETTAKKYELTGETKK